MAALIAITILLAGVAAAGGSGAKDVTSPPSEDPSIWTGQPPAGTSAPISPGRIGHPGNTVLGRVTIELAKSSFREGETVQATVANGLDQSVYTKDMQSNCGIVTLKRRQGDFWKPMVGCAIMRRPPSAVEIGAGEVVEVAIDPHREQPGVPKGSLLFGAGTYQVVFTYSLGVDGEGETNTVTSPEFAITR